MELLDGLATKVMLVKQVMQVSIVHLWINFRVIFFIRWHLNWDWNLMAKTKTFHDQYLENYLYRINNDVDGGVDGDEKVADVGQHCHPGRPGVWDHFLLIVEMREL